MKVGDYLICKKELRRGNNIILVGKKYKILYIYEGLSFIRIYISADFIYKYISADFIYEKTKDHSVIDGKGEIIFTHTQFLSGKKFENRDVRLDSIYNIEFYINDYFLDISEFREEKLKELGI